MLTKAIKKEMWSSPLIENFNQSQKKMNLSNQLSPKAYTQFAGLLYLLIAITGGFSIGYMPTIIIVSGDAAATAQNMLDNQWLFRLGIAGDIAVLLLEIVLTVMLYRIFKEVSKTVAMVATFSRLAMSVIMGFNLLNYLIPVLLLGGSNYLAVFETDQLEALALVFLDAHKYGEYVWQLFFGLHLIALGYLIFKSSHFPKIPGILMMVGSVGYSGDSISRFISLNNASISIVVGVLLAIAVLGELSFTFWLLIKGVKASNITSKPIAK